MLLQSTVVDSKIKLKELIGILRFKCAVIYRQICQHPELE